MAAIGARLVCANSMRQYVLCVTPYWRIVSFGQTQRSLITSQGLMIHSILLSNRKFEILSSIYSHVVRSNPSNQGNVYS